MEDYKIVDINQFYKARALQFCSKWIKSTLWQQTDTRLVANFYWRLGYFLPGGKEDTLETLSSKRSKARY